MHYTSVFVEVASPYIDLFMLLDSTTMPEAAYADSICRPAAIPNFLFPVLLLVYCVEIKCVRVVE
jgi:hypothetical protein